jgi:glucosamine--fructose-6-phosphate aminotransferase (isomerizing)
MNNSKTIENTYLYKEIHEQPRVLERLLAIEKVNIGALAKDMQERQIGYVVIAARGTSDNAARYANYLFGSVNRLPVALATPSLYTIYQKPPRFGNALVLGISQSGKSPDIVAVLAEARKQGVLTASMTNYPESDLAHVSDHVIDLQAGEEKSIAATKTYTSELVSVALLSALLAEDQEMLADLGKIPGQVQQTLAMGEEIRQITQRYRYMEACEVIGRGYNYATAYEIALKLKELTYTVVEAYSSADFLHGPMAMISPGFPVMVVAPCGAMSEELNEFTRVLNQRQAEVIAISDDPQALSLSRIPLRLPMSTSEWISPMTCVIPGQLFALYLAATRDYDPDHPRALHKVTETR